MENSTRDLNTKHNVWERFEGNQHNISYLIEEHDAHVDNSTDLLLPGRQQKTLGLKIIVKERLNIHDFVIGVRDRYRSNLND